MFDRIKFILEQMDEVKSVFEGADAKRTDLVGALREELRKRFDEVRRMLSAEL